MGTPLFKRVNEAPVCDLLKGLNSEMWLEPARIRFGALHQLIDRNARDNAAGSDTKLSSEEIRTLLRLAFETVEHTNIAQVCIPAVYRGFERLLARDDTHEMLDSLLLHIGTAYETEVWGQVRKLIVLDLINDLVAITVRNSVLHLLSAE